MKRILVISISILLLSCSSGTSLISSVEEVKNPISIIPTPKEVTFFKSSPFVLNEKVSLVFPQEMKNSSQFLNDFIFQGLGFKLSTKLTNRVIEFSFDASIINDEAYELSITTNVISIKANGDKGAFYAVQSLRQLLPISFENKTFVENEVKIPTLFIKDEPQFKYRGMMLDVGRHMFPVSFIKKYIDVL